MKTNLIENRQIRVFISSTFRDMQDERDQLMKFTFPRLRKLAAERDVTLTELDLRWGITEEESKSGKVVDICLREIENSVPFFIGIVGNRYGWIPEKKDLDDNVITHFPSVNDYLANNLSVTEMEMQFGVFERKEDMHAFFYIKDTTTQQSDMFKESDCAMQKLVQLKEAIRKSKYPSSTYSSIESLSEQVESAFVDLLEKLFPIGNLTEFEKEQISQRSYMNQLCQNYIRDDEYFSLIDNWMSDCEQHNLVITGASGLGKSALIANWIREKINSQKAPYNIAYIFVGTGGSLASHHYISKYLIKTICELYRFSNEDYTLEELNLKISSTVEKPLLIVLDAVNQIVDIDDAKLLNWLPSPSKNVKFLFTTVTNDKTLELFSAREYLTFSISPLSLDKRREFVRTYLKSFAKSLKNEQIYRIVSDPQCENTLVLKTFLNELVNFGIHEKLDEKIAFYLNSNSIEDFYSILLQAYETDYTINNRNLVREVLSLIAISEKGLSEEEIIQITGIKRINWSQFYCQFFANLIVRDGLIAFSHKYITDSVYQKYLTDQSEWILELRNKLLSYFGENSDLRAKVELLYQYYRINKKEELRSILIDLDVLKYYLIENTDLINSFGKYWQKVVGQYGISTLLFYKESISDNFELLIKTALFIKNYFCSHEVTYEYLELARKLLCQDNMILYLDTLGHISPNKSNEYFRKKIQLLKARGLENTTEYADTLIEIAKSNDYVGREASIELKEDEVEEKKQEMFLSSVETESKDSEMAGLEKELFYLDTIFDECHFEFEKELWGDSLQLAYYDAAIKTLEKCNEDKPEKLASYYMSIMDILWLCDEPVKYFPYLTKAYKIYLSLKTQKCPEVIEILRFQAEVLRDIIFNCDTEKDFVEVDKEKYNTDAIEELYNTSISLTKSVFGDNSIVQAENYKSFSLFYDGLEDFSKEYNCYKAIMTIYKSLNMDGDYNDAKEWIEHYIEPRLNN